LENVPESESAVVVKVRTALAETAQRRRVEVRLSRFIAKADVVGLGRCVSGRGVARRAFVLREDTLSALDGVGVERTAGAQQRGRRRQGTQIRRQIADLSLARRRTLHRAGDRRADLLGELVPVTVPRPLPGVVDT